jgi:hypothetical protein
MPLYIVFIQIGGWAPASAQTLTRANFLRRPGTKFAVGN